MSIVRKLQQALDLAGITSAVRPESPGDTPLGVTAYRVEHMRYHKGSGHSYDVVRIGLSPEDADRLAILILDALAAAEERDTDD